MPWQTVRTEDAAIDQWLCFIAGLIVGAAGALLIVWGVA